ncbi:L,D-transpeptidase [Desulfovibrio mangrovi]|uniref:L,D-transpeptidase family protein n=1 Tax=Desulfovibrio mangrovi TaxID=2976983 RepID=UPI0022486648|nr:L,D-transpeptidase [Desulfovibrio mangrovi]UZP67177.1 L,D-transpeptidase [Desulfovibrio mangrovi]
MRSALFSVLILSIVSLAFPQAGYSAGLTKGWQARFEEHPGIPPSLVAVDKGQQQLYLMEHKSPLAVAAQYVCTTGQIEGDKQDEGDKKTPEGVYFVQRHIPNGLDFGLYGGMAYTLNYPNPMDLLRKKSGHGIWVHGRGHNIVPRETQGCVAMNNADLLKLGPNLKPGTPVVLAHTIADKAPQTTEEKKIASAVLNMTREWATAWGNRDSVMFEYYDGDAYTKSQSGDFADFVATKERLFKNLPWILNWIDDIYVLQGPDYWVSWFKQYYRAPNLTVQGYRRLYWHKDTEGNLLIAGMEWERADLDLEPDFLKAQKQSIDQFIEGWRTAWESANLKKYAESYTESASQGTRKGIAAIRDHKKIVWVSAKPQKVRLSNPKYSVSSNGLTVEMIQQYSSSDGFSDKGIKILVLRPDGISWRIESEDWRPL